MKIKKNVNQKIEKFTLWRVSVLKYHACQQKQDEVLKTYHVLTLRVLKYHACQQIKRVEGSRFGGSVCSSTAPANKSKING